jgi:CHASE2 domain-containing sensor protein
MPDTHETPQENSQLDIRKSLSRYVKALRSKGKWHWILAVILIALGVGVEQVLDSYFVWERARYVAYHLFQAREIHPIRPKRTILILIGDDEYWNGELARRVPIKRDYLAKLLTTIDKGEPCEIILDFDFESPAPQSGSYEAAEYVGETKLLADAIMQISSRRKIILPRTITPQAVTNVSEPTVLDSYDFDRSRVGYGYINLPNDMRKIPLTAPLQGGGTIDSLATAAVRLIDPNALNDADSMRGEALPFGTFIEPEKFRTLTATEILTAGSQKLKANLECSLVVLGGVWHKDAYGRGKQADAVLTPVGKVPGVFVQANFIEALLDSRTFKALSRWQEISLGVLLSLLLAITTASPWQLGIRVLVVITIILLPVVISYFLVQNLGIFFDFFIPAVMILAHALVVRK